MPSPVFDVSPIDGRGRPRSNATQGGEVSATLSYRVSVTSGGPATIGQARAALVAAVPFGAAHPGEPGAVAVRHAIEERGSGGLEFVAEVGYGSLRLDLGAPSGWQPPRVGLRFTTLRMETAPVRVYTDEAGQSLPGIDGADVIYRAMRLTVEVHRATPLPIEVVFGISFLGDGSRVNRAVLNQFPMTLPGSLNGLRGPISFFAEQLLYLSIEEDTQTDGVVRYRHELLAAQDHDHYARIINQDGSTALAPPQRLHPVVDLTASDFQAVPI